MNTQRITVSLPRNTYEDLILIMGKGNVSSFVAEAVQDRLLEEKLKPQVDPIDAFLAHRKNLPKLSHKEIMDAIHKRTNMNYYVVDASVIIKTLLNESDTVVNRFTDLLRGQDKNQVNLLSSKMLALEVGNGIRYSVKDRTEAIKTYHDFFNLHIKTLVLTKNQKEKTLQLSYELGTTVYDTSYHVLAKAHNAVFLTCDEEYYKKAQILGDIELIK